jgi:hypothetical protein
MAKRIVQECDLCKGEYDPDDTHIISVKKKGKQKANVYDLCPNCAEKIQQQLVAQSSETLEALWRFGYLPVAEADVKCGNPEPEREVRGSRRAELESLQQADNDLISRKDNERRNSLKEAGQTMTEEAEATEVPYETVAPAPLEDGSCAHMNRGRIQAVQGQFLQECRDCGEKLRLSIYQQ